MILNRTIINRLIILIGVVNLLVATYLIVQAVLGVIDRYAVFTQFKQNNQALETKLSYLNESELLSVTYDGYIKALAYAIPQGLDLQEYLTLLNTAAGREGFILKAFRPVLEESKRISITADFRGGKENVPTLIKTLEALPRLTLVKSLKSVKEKNLYRVDVSLAIFYLDGAKE